MFISYIALFFIPFLLCPRMRRDGLQLKRHRFNLVAELLRSFTCLNYRAGRIYDCTLGARSLYAVLSRRLVHKALIPCLRSPSEDEINLFATKRATRPKAELAPRVFCEISRPSNFDQPLALLWRTILGRKRSFADMSNKKNGNECVSGSASRGIMCRGLIPFVTGKTSKGRHRARRSYSQTRGEDTTSKRCE